MDKNELTKHAAKLYSLLRVHKNFYQSKNQREYTNITEEFINYLKKEEEQ